jgi:uncharacterized protein YaaN involved in tellurite resistance
MEFGDGKRLGRIEEKLERALQLLTTIATQGDTIMASIAQGFSDLQNAINTLTGEESEVVTAIQQLQSQVAQGSPVTGAQLEALVTQVNTVNTGLTAAIAPAPAATGSAPGSAPAAA